MWDVPRDIDLDEHWRNLRDQRARQNFKLLLNRREDFIMTEKKEDRLLKTWDKWTPENYEEMLEEHERVLEIQRQEYKERGLDYEPGGSTGMYPAPPGSGLLFTGIPMSPESAKKFGKITDMISRASDSPCSIIVDKEDHSKRIAEVKRDGRVVYYDFSEEDERGNKYAKIVSSENGAEVGRTYENGEVMYHKEFVDSLREQIHELKQVLPKESEENTRGDCAP